MTIILLSLVSVVTLNLFLTTNAATPDWWEGASFYQIYPRSWKDSDGDGIGDLKGITENLDYLTEIGMTATWLSPIFKSPMADNGYDISNFTEIDPIFGTLEDIDDLIRKCKEIGLKIILDFVPNHSSDECAWFIKSINREDDYEDFYVWADGKEDPQNPGQKLPPSNWESEFGGSMWKWNEKRQQFYLHQFLEKQPEFNYRNEKVQQKMLDILKFWLDRGVDGFRVDAVAYLIEEINADGSYPDQDPIALNYTRDQNGSAELLYKWRVFLDNYQKENGGDTRVMLAEAYSPIEKLDQYCGNGTHNGAHTPFNFDLIFNLNKTSNAINIERTVDQWMTVMWKKHQVANWVTGNHDRFRIIERVGQNRTELVYFLTQSLPGSDITYYGEEIGMSNVVSCQNCSEEEMRAFARSPFQWDDSTSAGFSTSNNTWLPVSKDYKTVNVQNQLDSTSSSPLKVFIALQSLRRTDAFRAFKEKDGFSYGALSVNVFQTIRRSPNEEYRVLINFGDNEEDIGQLINAENERDNLMEYVVVSESSPHDVGYCKHLVRNCEVRMSFFFLGNKESTEKMANHILSLILLTFSLSNTILVETADWWEDASLYQIYPRSWKDSDGNGVGDLKGITQNLKYLKDIGMTATWLSPIFKSPMVDNGYDISNFTDIDPTFGTLDDFDDLMKKAKEIGLKIILDFVPNHSSDECEWFHKSINREDGYDDFYVWADGKDDPENPGKKLPPSNWIGIFGGSMWTWNEKRQQFYLHQFLDQQPDFNFRNEKVHKQMLDVLKFWLDRGVDGFRIDAVPHMYEKINEDGSYPDEDPNKNECTRDQYENVELLYEWREFLENYRKQNGGDTRVLLAEAGSPITMIDKYFGNGTHQGAHLPFNFAMADLRQTSNAKDIEHMIDSWMKVMWNKHKMANWLTGNHDKDRVFDSVGKNKAGLMNFLLTALPGVTITYYGEEIGMSNVVTCHRSCSSSEVRNFARSPFQWNDKVSAGFSPTNTTWLPVNQDYRSVNVKHQLETAGSTLNIFKALQGLKQTEAFKAFKNKGGFSYGALNDDVLQVIRRSPNDEYRFLMNFGDNQEKISELLSSSNEKDDLMEFVVVSKNSPHNVGEKAKLGDIKLNPFEGVVLHKV
ncbi:uncharacterized protein LOC129944747 [Eupeodes corollae]|uniref:uncharacterized protein LOC129944747 n=1 Tax=Eupeodes corollae TaxID=290404 RepID=UPI00249074D2|nr:uncharacterized protein LOC129944747 [Eupeodes corollae]